LQSSQELQVDEEFKNLIPALTDDERALLEKSILREGLREPILTWNGVIIDGHNRYEICKKHNIPIKMKELQFSSRDEAILWILNNQLGRRNLTPYQKARLALAKGKILEKEAKKRQAIGHFNAPQYKDKRPVVQNSEQLEKGRVLMKLEEEFGISHDTLQKVKKIEEKAPDEVKRKLENGEISIHRAYKIVKKIEQEEEREKLAEQGRGVNFDGENPKLINADFRDVEIEDNSVDLILTDPPYGKDYLELWRDLGKFAARVLKPSGFLVAYSGQAYLTEKLSYLSESLQYYWIFALYHAGYTQLTTYWNIIIRWKPVLIFQKTPFKKIETPHEDYVISQREEKFGHEWQQSESGARNLIEIFSKPNDVVLDPMMGSGTFPYVAYKLGRRAIGIEVDERSFNIAKARWKE